MFPAVDTQPLQDSHRKDAGKAIIQASCGNACLPGWELNQNAKKGSKKGQQIDTKSQDTGPCHPNSTSGGPVFDIKNPLTSSAGHSVSICFGIGNLVTICFDSRIGVFGAGAHLLVGDSSLPKGFNVVPFWTVDYNP